MTPERMDIGVERGWRATSPPTLSEAGFPKQSEALRVCLPKSADKAPWGVVLCREFLARAEPCETEAAVSDLWLPSEFAGGLSGPSSVPRSSTTSAAKPFPCWRRSSPRNCISATPTFPESSRHFSFLRRHVADRWRPARHHWHAAGAGPGRHLVVGHQHADRLRELRLFLRGISFSLGHRRGLQLARRQQNRGGVVSRQRARRGRRHLR